MAPPIVAADATLGRSSLHQEPGQDVKSSYNVEIALDFPKSPRVTGGVGAGRAFKPRGRAHSGGSASTRAWGGGAGCDVPSRITGAQVRTHRLPGSRQHSPPPLPIAELWTLPPEIACERARAWGKCAERRTQARTPPPPHFQTRQELLLVGPRSYAPQIASLSRPAGSGNL